MLMNAAVLICMCRSSLKVVVSFDWPDISISWKITHPQKLRATTFPTFSLFLSADSSSILPLLTCHLNSKAYKILSFAYTRSPWLDLLFAMQPYIFQTASMHHLISEPDSDVVQMKQLSHPSCQSFDHHLFETIASMAMQGRVQGIKV